MSKPDVFEEIADMMANSWTVGPYVDRPTILAALRGKFKTEDELRAKVGELFANYEELERRVVEGGGRIVGVAVEATPPPKGRH